MIYSKIKLDQVCVIRRGSTITKNQVKVGNIPVVAGGKTSTISHSEANREANTITVSASGASAGFVNFWQVPIFASDCSTVEVINDLADINYVYYFLKFKQDYLYSLQAGAAQPHVYAKDIAKIEIPIPPLSEQRRIASILDKADELRQKRQQAIAKLDQLVQATFIDMFGDPVSNPKGWVVADFEENIDFLTGFAFKSAEFQSSGMKLCRGINVLPKKLNWNDTAHWCVNDVEKFKKFKIIKNDILVAMDRPWISSGFKIVMIQDNDPEMLLVQRVARLRIKKEFGANFIFQIFSSPKFKEHCRITETTVPHISPTDFRTFKIIKPPHKLIEKYERIASLIHIQKANMLKADIFDEKLFKSIQNKAFSGTL